MANLLKKLKELALSIYKGETVTAKQNMARNRPCPGSAACGCPKPPKDGSDCCRTYSTLRLFLNFEVSLECASLLKGRAFRFWNCALFFIFFLQHTFSHLRISSLFLMRHQHLLSSGTRCLRLEGLSNVTVLSWLLVRRISLSNQHHLSALKSKSRHRHRPRHRKGKQSRMAMKQKKEKELPSVWVPPPIQM